ncbi:tyrosine-type recombinase/integrase [Nocardia cyriacigeorgica]|uniref:site-specific integrase n=1 Tax=Nocardia cyriacigeorgica TaxID=135487 RepID=UPI001894E5E2|nr:tyrosine-type recombinase/integrase [Nocardia cyriacigeorgica]MBF6092348.1 tyrosine-type recombinase/integrase [Nocardia cyriacigeorgica]MBF6162900.1 tyrosine-type recombinase/integrase [Nocardia cyriacigeorgica]MBF6201800.1 tyrosine-type recombinase/integrase [Nocardia cyriacigeorgica]MBF6315365.1 tyrosine-type recombinase/integrase [Nocardia cyriacigeorgica]MBF6530151.1 tyrosine-type recombinase/integrase [Nocardia cyriacigeorgica]
MPRLRMTPGEWGKITVTKVGPNKFTAYAYVRDEDGRRRRVKRSGSTEEDARRALQRYLKKRTTPTDGALVTERTTLAELFEAWIATKDGLKPQSIASYRDTWKKHGEPKLGELRVRELPTSRAERHIAKLPPSRARMLRVVLLGMFALAVREDVLKVNPIREVSRKASKAAPARALTPEEFAIVRSAVVAYRDRAGMSGPPRAQLLVEFIDVMASTGCRPNEVLGLRWSDVDLLADPPTMTTAGTALDHGKVAGKGVHRQDERKGGAPAHTVILPKLAVEALTRLFGQATDPDGPVFANRNGGWISLANMRRSLRAALPEELAWVTPYSFRRTVATVVRDDLGPAHAQAQLSHAKLSTTEQHYLQRQTQGPDARNALDRFAAGK